MKQVENVKWDEQVLPFELRNSDIRGRVVRLDKTVNDILSQHDYPKKVESLISEMVILTALLGSMVEPRWKLSLQVQTDGPVRMIATDYYAADKEGGAANAKPVFSPATDAQRRLPVALGVNEWQAEQTNRVRQRC